MLSIFKRILKKSEAVFKVSDPDIELTVSFAECVKRLKTAGVKYDQVCAGYITFSAKVFGNLDMTVGLHCKGAFVEYIEFFRPLEYYNSPDFDIKKSFAEIHNAVVSCYGKPQVEKPSHLAGLPSERWLGRNFVLDHYILDRFGPEEHLHFKFAHP